MKHWELMMGKAIFVRRIIQVILLMPVGLLLLAWCFYMLYYGALTTAHGEEFVGLESQTRMMQDAEHLKVMHYF